MGSFGNQSGADATARALATAAGVLAENSLGRGTSSNVVGARAFGTVYSNNTGRPMLVSWTGSLPSSARIKITVNGDVRADLENRAATTQTGASFSALVEAGYAYIITQTGGASTVTWNESF